MKERPILFSAPMVRAILDGRKTQTRRVVKCRYPWEMEEDDNGNPWPWYPDYVTGGEWDGWVECPYGRPGDRLWVRETWQGDRQDFDAGLRPAYAATDPKTEAGWRSPIHMPRWASRITLEVTGVRVERLQEISEADARSEGLRADLSRGLPAYSARQEFERLWQSINGPGSWDANPWVWVIEFTRIDAQQVSA